LGKNPLFRSRLLYRWKYLWGSWRWRISTQCGT